MSKNPLPKNYGYQSDRFPIGMQVLAIDENIVSLTYLVTLLRKCQYEVTSTTKAAEALELLRREKENFDIVITDVVRLDMDGFKLLEIIRFEMDIPVIMVSTNDDRANIMRGIRNGAQDFLVKPVRLQEMMNIWQHVVRKNLSTPERSFKINKGKAAQNPMPFEEEKTMTMKEEEATDSDSIPSGTSKKPRLNWSPELHSKFLNAVQQLGGEQESKPIQILKRMNVPELTRENVSSHLQKYRIMLRKNNGITSAQANITGGVGTSRAITTPNIDIYGETSSASLLLKSKQQISSFPSAFSPSKQINRQPEISMDPNLRITGHQIHQSIMHSYAQGIPYTRPLQMGNHFPMQDLKFSSSFHPGMNFQNVSQPGIVSHFSSTNNGSHTRDDHQLGVYNYESCFKYPSLVMLRENSTGPENAI